MAPNNLTRNNRSLHVRLKRQARYYYLRLLRINDPPERIARGVSIGVIMGILPTFGLGTVFAFALSFVFRANKAAAVIGSVIMNPLTQPFFIAASITLGSALTGEDSATILAEFKKEGIAQGLGRASLVYVVGNSIISAFFAFISYFLVRGGVVKHRERKAARRLAKKEREERGER